MLLRTLSIISQNSFIKKTAVILLYILMGIAILMAVLISDAQEIEFVYANF